MNNMNNYWNQRYSDESKIWGDRPSKTAEYALEIFKKNKLKNLLIPGIGYGRNANIFIKNDFIVDGIEISGVAIKLTDKNIDKINIYHGDVLDMPYSNKAYDCIYCFNTLHLFRKNEREIFIQKCLTQLAPGGIAFFAVFSEKESSFGKGNMIEENTFESKPGRPVHYFMEEDLVIHFNKFTLLETGLMEDPENHGKEGTHKHLVRYIAAQKPETYEFDGEKYKKASAHQKEWGDKIISGLKLTGSERILDLGCGDGYLTRKLSELVPQGEAAGIDASRGMIETADKLKGNNLSFKLEDIGKLNYNEEFDVIFSNATLHWVRDHKKLLDDVYKSLKINGYIRFNFAGEGNCSYFYKVIKEVMLIKNYKEYFTDFVWPWYMPNINEYKKLVIDSNFRDVNVWEENADRNFPDKESIIKWIDQPSIVPFLKLVSEKDKEEFRKSVISKMLAETIREDGTYFETFRRINVLAFKK